MSGSARRSVTVLWLHCLKVRAVIRGPHVKNKDPSNLGLVVAISCSLAPEQELAGVDGKPRGAGASNTSDGQPQQSTQRAAQESMPKSS